jgi:hypothetical protein
VLEDIEYINIKVSRDFKHPLFFEKDYYQLPFNLPVEKSFSIPFYFDLLYLSDTKLLQSVLPWEHARTFLPLLTKQWNEQQPMISEYFKSRDRKHALQPMKECLALLLDALFWGNNKPVKGLVDWENEVNCLPIKPVNAVERLSYIFQMPNHYHSFIQLQQLFDEFNKKYQISLLNNN